MANRYSRSFFRYFIIVAIGAFVSTTFFSFLAEFVTRSVANIVFAVILLLVIILIGILFDILGTAVCAAREAPFHARAAKRVLGAQQGVFLIRNADKVANFSNDIVGDIANTVAGALGISLIVQISMAKQDFNTILANVLITAAVASLTVSGKLVGKRIALERANDVVFVAGRILAGLQRFSRSSQSGGNNKPKHQPKVWRR